MVAERIPAGGTDAATRFPDAEIDELLEGADTIEASASAGWQRKADMAFDERGGMEENTAGSERTKYAALKDYAAFCQQRAEFYADLIPDDETEIAGSQMGFVEEPVALGINTDPLALVDDYEFDLTRAGAG